MADTAIDDRKLVGVREEHGKRLLYYNTQDKGKSSYRFPMDSSKGWTLLGDRSIIDNQTGVSLQVVFINFRQKVYFKI